MDATDALRPYVPEQVARALLVSGGELEPVEAEATILMCDIEVFAALTDALGPRGTFDFLNCYFETLVTIVERHGGVVTRFQGDAILAAFNLPRADPDHRTAALRAAIEMVHSCEANACAGAPIRNRVGVATGRVIAGAVGSRGRLSYTVHGNAVNLAARLEMLNKRAAVFRCASSATPKCAALPRQCRSTRRRDPSNLKTARRDVAKIAT